jgi:hypothetical protein
MVRARRASVCGNSAPYLVDGLGALAGQTGAFVALTVIITGLALWTAGYAARLRRSVRGRNVTPLSGGRPGNAIPCHDKVTRRSVRIIKNLFWTERVRMPASGPPRPLPLVPVDRGQ